MVLRLDHIGRQNDPKSQSANQFAQSIVVGKMIRYRFKATDRLQRIAPQAQGLAGGVALVTEEPRQQHCGHTWELVSAHRYEVRHRGPCVALADDFEVADDAALHQFLRLEWRDLLQAALLHLVERNR